MSVSPPPQRTPDSPAEWRLLAALVVSLGTFAATAIWVIVTAASVEPTGSRPVGLVLVVALAAFALALRQVWQAAQRPAPPGWVLFLERVRRALTYELPPVAKRP